MKLKVDQTRFLSVRQRLCSFQYSSLKQTGRFKTIMWKWKKETMLTFGTSKNHLGSKMVKIKIVSWKIMKFAVNCGKGHILRQQICHCGREKPRWQLNVLFNYWVISRTGPKTERLTILRAATHEIELGDYMTSVLSRSHYTDTNPTSREQAATAGIEPRASPPGVACSTDWATAPISRGKEV